MIAPDYTLASINDLPDVVEIWQKNGRPIGA
jgi:hypothetical protein